MEHHHKLLVECQGCLDQGLYADLQLIGLNDGVKIPFNSLLLGSACPWMSQSLMVSGGDQTVVAIEGTDSNAIKTFIEALVRPPEELTDGLIESLMQSEILDILMIRKQIPTEPEPVAQVEESQNPLECKACGKVFKLKKLLNRHFRTEHASDNPYTCLQCNRKCRGASELEIHSRIHTKEKPFLCGVCEKRFTQKSHLNDHLAKVHEISEKKHSCDICGLVLASAAAVRKHANIHVNPEVTHMSDDPEISDDTKQSLGIRRESVGLKSDRDYSCSVCNKTFSQRSHLTVHSRIHTGEKPFMCSHCGKQFSVASNLKKHASTHLKDNAPPLKENVCEICGRMFASLKDLQTHAKSHSLTQPHTCSHCSESFQKKTDLKIHEKTHTGETQLRCDNCDLKCISQSALDKHMLIHTGERPHSCPQCGKSFIQKSHVNYHIKTVHGAPPSGRAKTKICAECGAMFTTASTLSKHMKTHSNERPHICNFCGKGFIQKAHLITHKRRHTGERPYTCSTCNKSFMTDSAVKEHFKTHTKTRTYHQCNTCSAKYYNLSDLKIHLRKHTGERPFICATCGKGFISKRLLADHSRVHSGHKPFVCKNCGKSFTAASGLRQHFLRHDTCRLSASPGTFSLQPESLPQPLGTTVLMELDASTNTLSQPELLTLLNKDSDTFTFTTVAVPE